MRVWAWDGVGAGLSGLCAVHCALGPVVVGMLPLAGRVWTSPWVHLGSAAVVVPVAAWAFGRGYRRHRRARGPVLGALGLAVLLGVVAGEWVWGGGCAGGHDGCRQTWAGLWLNLMAAGLLVSGHGLNGFDGNAACAAHGRDAGPHGRDAHGCDGRAHGPALPTVSDDAAG